MDHFTQMHCNMSVTDGKITNISIHSIPEEIWKLLPGKRTEYQGTLWKQSGRYTFFIDDKKGTQDDHHES